MKRYITFEQLKSEFFPNLMKKEKELREKELARRLDLLIGKNQRTASAR